MNTTVTTASQANLIAQLEAQEDKYTRAAQLIERLASAGTPTDPALQKDLISLQLLLAEIRTAAAHVDTARLAYEAEDAPRSPQLTAALQQQSQKLRTFLAQIDSLKSSFVSGKEALEMQLDSQTTRRSMQNAYRQSMKTG